VELRPRIYRRPDFQIFEGTGQPFLDEKFFNAGVSTSFAQEIAQPCPRIIVLDS